jgi:hypothetical protein
MHEGEMDHTIRRFCGTAKAIQIIDVAAMRFDAMGPKRFSLLLGSREGRYGMACSDQFLNDGRADEPGSPSHKYTHGLLLFVAACARMGGNVSRNSIRRCLVFIEGWREYI